MIQRIVDKILIFLTGPISAKLDGILAAFAEIRIEQLAQRQILERIEAAVVNEQAARIEIIEGPPEEQP